MSPRQDETSEPLLYAGWMAGPYRCKDATRGRNDDPVTLVRDKKNQCSSEEYFSSRVTVHSNFFTDSFIALMDDNTICLLLKNHQDAMEKLAQQQAAAFQALFDTLRAELQESWIFAINVYFTLLNTLVDQLLRIVGFNLKCAAVEWFQWMSRNGLITTWARFEKSVKNRFGPSKYKDPNGVLSKLLQLGTVEDYQREFKKLMNMVTDIPNSLLIPLYISGLKLHLQRGLLVSKPTTFGKVFLLARTIEARCDDQAALVAGTSAGLEANKVVNNGDDSESLGPVTPTSDSESLGEVNVLNWVQQAIDVERTSDYNAQDQASELETKVLVDGKQDEAKVVDVADEQNSDEPDVLEGNRVIGRLNDKYIKKKKMKVAMQRRLWDLEIQDKFFRQHLEDNVGFEGVESVTTVSQEDGRPKRPQRKKSKPV
nr:hypothetical protein [Tanacetum cinerariifolium]